MPLQAIGSGGYYVFTYVLGYHMQHMTACGLQLSS